MSANTPAPLEWTGPFRRPLGDCELTVVTDRTYTLDGGAFFGVVPKSLWSRHAPCDERNLIRCGLNSLIVRRDRQLAVIETGCGNKLDERQMRHWGVDPRRDYPERLAAAGVAPEAVDLVINTHLHYDHCGWNTLRRPNGSLAPLFPRARYFVQRGEWEHAREQNERDRVSYLSENYDPLVDSGQMELLNGDRELAPGISVQVLPGHTRSMQAVLIRSGGQTACYISDLLPSRWHLKPTWLMAFDLFPLETIANKRRILDQALREDWLFVFTHDPEVPWARLERGAAGELRWAQE